MKELIDSLSKLITDTEKLPASPHVSVAIGALKAARDNLNGEANRTKPAAAKPFHRDIPDETTAAPGSNE